MVEKVPSLKGGGAYWFTDLTTPDDYFILPVLTSLTFLATVEVCILAAVVQVFYLLICCQDTSIFISAPYARWYGRQSYGENNEKGLQSFWSYVCSACNRLSEGI